MSKREAASGGVRRMPSIAFSPIGPLVIHSLSYDLDRPVVTFNDTAHVVTAREFRDVISRYAQALQAIGLKKGARVGLISRNRAEVLFLLGAIPFVNVCVVALHPMGSLDEAYITYMVEDAHGIEAMRFSTL